MTSGERSVVSISSRSSKPTKPAGIVPNSTAQASRLSPTSRRCATEQHPIARHRRERGAEVGDDGHQRAEVDRDIELEPLVGPVREIRHENQVARARNRQELSDSLNDGKDDDLQRIHEARPGKRSTARMLAANRGPQRDARHFSGRRAVNCRAAAVVDMPHGGDGGRERPGASRLAFPDRALQNDRFGGARRQPSNGESVWVLR